MKRLRSYIILSIMLAIFMLTASNVNAQISDMRNNLAVGINGGLNFSSVSFSPNIKQSTLQGITGGITVRYISEKYFSMICGLQMELNYSQKGWKEKIEDGTNNTYQRTLNYVEIPFLAHVAFGKERGMRFFINAGPQIGFFINDKEEKGGDPWNTNYRPNNVTAQYGKSVENKFEYGIAGGLGLELRTGIGNFLLEGRYFYGLSDFYHNSKSDDFGRSGNSVITGKLTYLFDLSK